VAPALNAFAMGFPLKILLTVLLSATLFIALPWIVSALTGQALDVLAGVS
jgi:flagellar biosynthetic protein FliR